MHNRLGLSVRTYGVGVCLKGPGLGLGFKG